MRKDEFDTDTHHPNQTLQYFTSVKGAVLVKLLELSSSTLDIPILTHAKKLLCCQMKIKFLYSSEIL